MMIITTIILIIITIIIIIIIAFGLAQRRLVFFRPSWSGLTRLRTLCYLPEKPWLLVKLAMKHIHIYIYI